MLLFRKTTAPKLDDECDEIIYNLKTRNYRKKYFHLYDATQPDFKYFDSWALVKWTDP